MMVYNLQQEVSEEPSRSVEFVYVSKAFFLLNFEQKLEEKTDFGVFPLCINLSTREEIPKTNSISKHFFLCTLSAQK